MKINILTPTHLGGPYVFGDNLTEALMENGIQTSCIHDFKKIMLNLVWQNADIIHSSGVPIPYHLGKKPIVFTIHGDFTIERNVWQPLYPIAIKHADIITTPSNFLKERLNLSNAIVIPNAVVVNNFIPVKHSAKVCVNLVTITNFLFKGKAKGILDIVEILNSIPKDIRSRIKYSIVGDGPYLNDVMKSASGCNIKMEFMRMIPSPIKILNDSDIFVYHSDHDNFPIVILEAMASGLPVVTNNVGAVSEVIAHGVDGFIAEDAKSYVEYLSNLVIDSDLRSQIGHNARATAETRYNFDKVSEQFIKVYNQIK